MAFIEITKGGSKSRWGGTGRGAHTSDRGGKVNAAEITGLKNLRQLRGGTDHPRGGIYQLHDVLVSKFASYFS